MTNTSTKWQNTEEVQREISTALKYLIIAHTHSLTAVSTNVAATLRNAAKRHAEQAALWLSLEERRN